MAASSDTRTPVPDEREQVQIDILNELRTMNIYLEQIRGIFQHPLAVREQGPRGSAW